MTQLIEANSQNLINPILSTKEKIMELIQGSPGICITHIRKCLDIGNGTVYYHISKLEKEERVFSLKRGRERVFWDKEYTDFQPYFFLSIPCQKIINSLISSDQRLSVTQISNLLEISHSLALYHINELASQGLVHRTKLGRKILCNFVPTMID